MGAPKKWKNKGKRAESSANAARDSTETVPKPAEKPVSLAPLEFEEALKGLLKVKPELRGGKSRKG